MMQKIQNRRDHLVALTAAARIHASELKTMSKDLEIELASLQKAEQMFAEVKKESEATQGRVNFLQKSIAGLRARPEINRINHTTHQLAKYKIPQIRGKTPISTPVAGNHATTPASTPSTGGTIFGSDSSFRSLVGTPLDLQLFGGGNEPPSSSDDEDDPNDVQVRDSDLDESIKGTDINEGGVVDKMHDFLSTHFES